MERLYSFSMMHGISTVRTVDIRVYNTNQIIAVGGNAMRVLLATKMKEMIEEFENIIDC
jgi:hypothetical protein